MLISDDFMAELKSRIEIENVIGQYVNLQRKGKNLMGVCPFHAEKTPSFCVYPNNGSFYCFGCGAGGDAITFLRLIEHYGYVEAVKNLAQSVGMDFEISEEDSDLHAKKLLIYKLNREAAKFYHKTLCEKSGEKALKYLHNRGISNSTIKHFGLGYSPENGYSLVDYFKRRGYNVEDIILSDLAFKSRNGKEIDRFRDRLMFPIIDVRGNVIAFGARTMGSSMPKYLNTSDTLVFKKSLNLFALNFAKKTGNNTLILAEGYMDVISLHQAGFENAVAGLGTALTEKQVKLLSRSCDEVMISYDSDGPGQKAANRAIEMLKKDGLKVKVLTIPKAKDPDEYLRTQGKDGAIKFKDLLEKSKTDIEYKLNQISSNYDLNLAEDKIKYLTEASQVLANCQSSIEREIYAIKLSEKTQISKSAILLQIEKYIKQNNRKNAKKEFKNIEKLTCGIDDKINPDKYYNLRAASAEESLISCIINNPEIANTIFSKLPVENVVTGFNRRILEAIRDITIQNKTVDITEISKYGFSFAEIGKITKMACSYNTTMGMNDAINEYISIINEENKKNKLKNTAEIPETEIMDYIKKLKKK